MMTVRKDKGQKTEDKGFRTLDIRILAISRVDRKTGEKLKYEHSFFHNVRKDALMAQTERNGEDGFKNRVLGGRRSDG